ncbi:MAG TPA: carboxypeptidase-like regulatory domain-containing protein [Candidatus Sulfotelmatobacter sp.]|nr:carboxypeptidase-like regulatory domain-containing protein [Candidatus Sulfotelmatobacter sp.]
MNRHRSVIKAASLVLLMVLGLTAVASAAPDKKEKTVGRLLLGKVLDHQDNPLPDSVVYVTNTRTRAVKTYIVGTDGTYRFPALSTAVDYEVYAQYKGHKSDTKSVSQFDDRSQVNIVLRIDTH